MPRGRKARAIRRKHGIGNVPCNGLSAVLVYVNVCGMREHEARAGSERAVHGLSVSLITRKTRSGVCGVFEAFSLCGSAGHSGAGAVAEKFRCARPDAPRYGSATGPRKRDRLHVKLARVASRGPLRKIGILVDLNAVISRRRQQNLRPLVARWEAAKVALLAERERRQGEKPMD